MKKIFKLFCSLLRQLLLTVRKNHFGRSTFIEKNVLMQNTKVGSYSYIGPNSCYNDVIIGNYCSLSADVLVGGMEHSYWDVSTSTRLSNSCVSGKLTIIGNDVWIGANSIIRQGITIGDGAVIGANSFVNTDVPPYAIVFGNPAKVYKLRFAEGVIKTIEESGYWNYPPKEAKHIIEIIKKETGL